MWKRRSQHRSNDNLSGPETTEMVWPRVNGGIPPSCCWILCRPVPRKRRVWGGGGDLRWIDNINLERTWNNTRWDSHKIEGCGPTCGTFNDKSLPIKLLHLEAYQGEKKYKQFWLWTACLVSGVWRLLPFRLTAYVEQKTVQGVHSIQEPSLTYISWCIYCVKLEVNKYLWDLRTH